VSVSTQVETVRSVVTPVVAALGLDLYDVELNGAGPARTLRVTVAQPAGASGGIDLDAITDVTRAISPALDASPALSGPYLLEVSSPGVERTLRRPEHFRGAVGETVTVKFHTEAGPRRVRGTLVEADDDRCVVATDDGEPETIALHDVTNAHTIFEWGPQPRPGSAGKKGKKESGDRA
jgi:ribosome maturation factor RimP